MYEGREEQEVFHRYTQEGLLDDLILRYDGRAAEIAHEQARRLSRRVVEKHPRSRGWCVVTWYAN